MKTENSKRKPNGRNDGHHMNYSKATSQIFIGSDFCQGGICLIHSEEFKKIGITSEINLSHENNELPPKDLETSYTWLPVVDGYAPTFEQLKIGSDIINNVVEGGKKVYVHCRNGHGRSPTLVAAYFIRFKNKSVDEAISLIKTARPEIHVEEAQRSALVEFKKGLSN